MFRNYFKLALRTFYKNKVHSFINIVGLSVGMGVALLIGFWVWDEISSAGALLITLATVSFHAIKAALMNPVKSLGSE